MSRLEPSSTFFYLLSLPRKSQRTSRRSRESGKEKVLEVQDNERKGPQGSSRALGREAVEKQSACLRGSQVIEEPCVSGEDSSSIRLALVVLMVLTVVLVV